MIITDIVRNSKKLLFLIIFISFFLFSIKVSAGSASFQLNGDSNVYVGKEVTVQVSISGVTDADSGVVSASGNIIFDSSYLEYISATCATSPYLFQINPANNYRFNGLDTTLSNGIKTNTTIVNLTFKTKKIGSTTVQIANAMMSDTKNKLDISSSSKTINILEPPSNNNNLSALSVSDGNLNFQKDITSYQINVDSNVSIINISAVTEDSNARIDGTGNKNLNYGNNSFSIVVTAANGEQKKYIININREDNRSSNNNLKTLTINEGKIEFNKNIKNYTIDVPYSVDKININAVAEDNKATVTINGESNLIAEEANEVRITVTSENQKTNIYTIIVNRGKDPNKVLSNNNNLIQLKASEGNLIFDKNVLNYQIIVPFETEEVNFEAIVEDTKYAKIEEEFPDKLKVGKNYYRFNVIAEDGSKKVYTVVVIKEKDPNAPLSDNTYLSSIEINNGNLDKTFDKNIYTYKYKKNGEIKLNAIAEDEESRVIISEYDNIYSITVLAPNDDVKTYTLIPQTNSNNFGLIVGGIASGITLPGLGFILGRKLPIKKKQKFKSF